MRNEIGDRLVDFAAASILMTQETPEKSPARKLSDQLIRCVTSVGANYEEAQAAESRRDFLHKLQVALKEMRETYYWLRVITKISSSGTVQDALIDEARQLRAILSKSVATAKGKAK
jgi:four helix bundle protein